MEDEKIHISDDLLSNNKIVGWIDIKSDTDKLTNREIMLAIKWYIRGSEESDEDMQLDNQFENFQSVHLVTSHKMTTTMDYLKIRLDHYCEDPSQLILHFLKSDGFICITKTLVIPLIPYHKGQVQAFQQSGELFWALAEMSKEVRSFPKSDEIDW